MKLPRDVSGDRLIRHLVRHWEYRIDIQQGSHVILVTERPIHHRLSVPNHKPMALGTFRAILGQVAITKGIDIAALLHNL